MSQTDLIETAKLGNPQAIATLMNRTLQPKGVTAKAVLKNKCLEVLLESSQIPDKEMWSTFIRTGLSRLKPQNIEIVKIYGRQIDNDTPSWSTQFELVAQENPFSLSEESSILPTPIAEPKENQSIKTEHKNTSHLKTNPLQTPAQKKIAKSKASEYAISGAIVGLIFSLPSVWAIVQMLQLQGGSDFVMIYVIGIAVVVFFGYLSGFGKGLNLFDVICPSCSHKFILPEPGGECPACNTGLYINAEGDCQMKMEKR